MWCGFVLYHLYCFQVYSYTTGTTQYLFHNQNGSKIVLCANNCRPQMELFCTIETFFVPTTSSVPHCTTNGFFQDGICVVWVCFVPFRTVFVLCGFVLYHCGLVSSFFVFVVYNLKHTVHFSQPKMSQNLYCVPLVAHHEWVCFVPLKLFLYQLVQKKFH